MLYIPWMVISWGHDIKKQVSETSIFRVPLLKTSISRMCIVPFLHVSHYWWNTPFASLERVWTGPWQGYRLQKKKAFRILVRTHRHNIPTCTPQRGYHGDTEVARTAIIATVAK